MKLIDQTVKCKCGAGSFIYPYGKDPSSILEMLINNE